jgi:hypothetical protein
VSLPGPPAGLWGVSLVVFALAIALVGELVRRLAVRWVPLWKADEPIERFLLDFFLGGAVVYLLAAIPAGGFRPLVVLALPVGAAAVLAFWGAARRRAARDALDRWLAQLLRTGPLLAIATAAGLLAVELGSATAAATGNTFDSSLLATYTALLLQHGSIPLSFEPSASVMILYPQGTTVWLGTVQLLFGLPAARTSLLVTPLFLSLAPLGGYVLGRRLLGTEAAGAAFALVLGWLGPSTRALVGGSNDFVFAFPLVLLLAAQTTVWMARDRPRPGDAIGFGLLIGYSAAINPVGAEWLLPSLLALSLAGAAWSWSEIGPRLGRWALTLAASFIGVIPSVYVLARGFHSPGFVPGAAAAPSSTPPGVSWPQWVGGLDPFLWRPNDIELAPIPAIRAELAVLLLIGAALLVLLPRGSATGAYLARFRRWVLASYAGMVGWLLILFASRSGVPVATGLAALSSGAELSLWVFTVYAVVAAVPLVLLMEWLAARFRTASRVPARSPRPPLRRSRTGAPGRPPGPVIVPLLAALVIVVPGVVLTPTQLPTVLTDLYHDFGNVSVGDFALFTCAGAHLPSGSRVVVAPGSAAEFLPGYVRGIVLLYPLLPGWPWINDSYNRVVSDLTNGTLGPGGVAALSALDAQYVAVTGNSTRLWPAFSPAPLLADGAHFSVLFHSGDAYLFATAPAVPPFDCP